MLDFSKMIPVKPKAEFFYWFLRKGTTNVFAVIRRSDNAHIANYISDGIEKEDSDGSAVEILVEDDMKSEDIEDMEYNIRSEYAAYTKRPEFLIGTKIPDELLTDNPIDNERMRKMKSICEQFITGCCYMMYEDEAAKKYSDRAIKWLASTDFYTAPASTKYHDSEPTGLLKHTLKVVNRVIDLTSIDPFRNINLAEAILVAIVHDWCKINFYESFMRNAKNDATGVWEHRLGDLYPPSHGNDRWD